MFCSVLLARQVEIIVVPPQVSREPSSDHPVTNDPGSISEDGPDQSVLSEDGPDQSVLSEGGRRKNRSTSYTAQRR